LHCNKKQSDMNTPRLTRIIAAVYLAMLSVASSAQSLTLDSCRNMARQNYPAIQQLGLVEQSCDLTISNASKSWLPGISAVGFGAVFSDMIDSPQFGDMENGVYGAGLTISQVIYDGGAIGAQKRVARAKAESDKNQLEVELYKINERVEQLYFGILMIDEQTRQVDLLQDNLSISEKTVRSMIDGGLANQSDLDQVLVSQVQAEQQLLRLKTMRKTYMQMLGYFVGRDDSLTIEKPSSETPTNTERPELRLFASQENLVDEQRKSLNTKLMPTVSAFGSAAIHSKILPIMNDKNLMAGLMLRWNIGAIYTRKNDLAMLENQQRQIESRRETFVFNNNQQQLQANGQIESLREQISLDDKAVALREGILEKTRKKVELGTESVNELLRSINAVSDARQQKALHEIQLLQEIYKLNNIKGL